jgi:hypothetical protein
MLLLLRKDHTFWHLDIFSFLDSIERYVLDFLIVAQEFLYELKYRQPITKCHFYPEYVELLPFQLENIVLIPVLLAQFF